MPGLMCSLCRMQGMMVPEADARLLFQQLIVAMDYCHRLGIVNRDVKVPRGFAAYLLVLLHLPAACCTAVKGRGLQVSSVAMNAAPIALPPSLLTWSLLFAAAGQHSAARRRARHPEAVRLWVLQGRRDGVRLQDRLRHARVHGSRGGHRAPCLYEVHASAPCICVCLLQHMLQFYRNMCCSLAGDTYDVPLVVTSNLQESATDSAAGPQRGSVRREGGGRVVLRLQPVHPAVRRLPVGTPRFSSPPLLPSCIRFCSASAHM